MQGAEFAFETRDWTQLVAGCYGFEDCSIRIGEACLPLLLTRSPLLGDKLVSAVFNGYASARYASDEEAAALLDAALERAARARVDLLEIRSVRPLPEAVARARGFVLRMPYRTTHLRLAPYEEIERGYERRFRKHLRHARRQVTQAGIELRRSARADDLRRFYDLLARCYRDRHRMIPQPFRLFELVHEAYLARGRGDLWIARTARGELAAGLLFLIEGGTVTGLFGAAAPAFARLSIDTVLKDHTIRAYAEQGLRLYDFGITSPKQTGVLFAKSRFGGESFALPFYARALRGRELPQLDYADAFAWLRRPFRWMPLPLVKRLSPLVTPYLN